MSWLKTVQCCTWKLWAKFCNAACKHVWWWVFHCSDENWNQVQCFEVVQRVRQFSETKKRTTSLFLQCDFLFCKLQKPGILHATFVNMSFGQIFLMFCGKFWVRFFQKFLDCCWCCCFCFCRWFCHSEETPFRCAFWSVKLLTSIMTHHVRERFLVNHRFVSCSCDKEVLGMYEKALSDHT